MELLELLAHRLSRNEDIVQLVQPQPRRKEHRSSRTCKAWLCGDGLRHSMYIPWSGQTTAVLFGDPACR